MDIRGGEKVVVLLKVRGFEIGSAEEHEPFVLKTRRKEQDVEETKRQRAVEEERWSLSVVKKRRGGVMEGVEMSL